MVQSLTIFCFLLIVIWGGGGGWDGESVIIECIASLQGSGFQHNLLFRFCMSC